MTTILEGEYTSSDSGETDDELEQLTQNPITTTEKPEPELIVFGESAMRYRKYAQGAGLIRKRPVVINGVDYPRNRSNRILHGYWPIDITRSWHMRACMKPQDREVVEWMHENEISLYGNDVRCPVFKFAETGFPKIILKSLTESQSEPTVIQSITWPNAVRGRDLISVARESFGKALAYILPGILHTLRKPKRAYGEGPSVLVLLPMREMALQVQEEVEDYCSDHNLSIACIFGPSPRNPQLFALRQGVDVLIATPGRLLDFLDAGVVNFFRCSYVVVDEADLMLEKKLLPQVRRIMKQIRPDRQTLLLSSTWPEEIRVFSREFQKNVVLFSAGVKLPTSQNLQMPTRVQQIPGGRGFGRSFHGRGRRYGNWRGGHHRFAGGSGRGGNGGGFGRHHRF
ncbi:hypothetical protein L596_016225 [Steinernema carpocapsae]|nr:hypothetical protein L596_016225 [Steinernema carpocapsae]